MKHISYIGNRSRKTSVMLLSILVITGIIAGSIYQSVKKPEPFYWLHQYFAPVFSGINLFEYMRNGILISMTFAAAAFLLGFFAFGQPFGAALLIYRGFGIGASTALMYSLYGGKAFAAVLVTVLPKAAALTFIAILAVRELIRASVYSLSCWTTENGGDSKRMSIQLYCLKFIVLAVLTLIVAVADAAVNFAFSG
jgi:hypothetical protein